MTRPFSSLHTTVNGWHDSDVLGFPIRVHDMTGDDLGIAHVPTPVETGDLILLERREYRVLDVILLEDEQSPLYALVRAQQPAHVRTLPTLSGITQSSECHPEE